MDHAILRQSLVIILEREPALVPKFYDALFARRPDIRDLFKSRGHQEKMLARALVAMVDRIEDTAWIDEQLTALGERHFRYGITAEMYVPFGEALLEALASIAGSEWTAPVEAAWRAAFGEITRMMLQGTAKAAAATRAGRPDAGPA